MEEKNEEKKSESEILFPGIELYGLTVMPWSHDRFVAVIPILLRMWKRMQGEGLTLADLSKITDPGNPPPSPLSSSNPTQPSLNLRGNPSLSPLKLRGDEGGLRGGEEGLRGDERGVKGGSFDILERLLPLIPVKEIVSKTLDVPLSEVEGWPFDKTDSLFLAIFMQNGQRIIGLLKNLGGLAGTIRGILAKA